MKNSILTGVGFGITSGIITTLGLIVGLNSVTQSKLAVIGGILTIAIADAFSDAMGIHMSEEAKKICTPREIWESTLSTLLGKFFFALVFIIPVLLLELNMAVIISIIGGGIVLAIFSFMVALSRNENPWVSTTKHLLIATGVVIVTHYLGIWIRLMFG